MSDPLKNIDARTGLAGTSKLEILLFTLGKDKRTGREETFGIDVFRVREVMRLPAITRATEIPSLAEGKVSLHGVQVPVIDLATYIGIETDCKPENMIATGYSGRMQGFLVRTVENILFLDWSAMRAPPAMLQEEMSGLVTAITELNDGRLVMLLDVEKVLAETCRFDIDKMEIDNVQPPEKERTELNADDSWVARNQISRTFAAMQVEKSHGEYTLGGGRDGMHDQTDARTSQAGTSKMEILLFSLGSNEKFGINVFGVKEVCPAGKITRTPNMPSGVDGIVLLHGHVVPVLNLANIMGVLPQEKHRTMMVAEFNKRMLGFLVKGVDRIIRVENDKVHAAGRMLSGNGVLTGSIAELEDGTLVSILDVNQIIACAFGERFLEVLCE